MEKLDEETTSDIEIIYSKQETLREKFKTKLLNDSMDDQEFNAILSDVCFKYTNDCSDDVVAINVLEKAPQHETPKRIRRPLIANERLSRLQQNRKKILGDSMKQQNDCFSTNFLKSSQPKNLFAESCLASNCNLNFIIKNF